jgi:hypothetical protein
VNLGVDYRVCSHFAIGFTAGYAHTDANLANGSGTLENEDDFQLRNLGLVDL